MEKQDVQDQSASEELTEEQADELFEARLRGVDEGETPDAEPAGAEESGEGDEATAEAPKESPDDELKRLRSENDARQKEIDRLRKLGRDTELESLRKELEDTKAKIQQGGSKKNPIDDWDAAKTADQLALWEDRVDEYRETGESEKLEQAKAFVRAIRRELPKKWAKETQTQTQAQQAEQSVNTGMKSLQDLVLDTLPDIITEGSDMNKLANEEMADPQYQVLNDALGQTGASLYATLRMILKNPDILPRKGQSKPKETIKEVEKALSKGSMSTGAKNGAPERKALTEKEENELFEGLLRGTVTSI